MKALPSPEEVVAGRLGVMELGASAKVRANREDPPEEGGPAERGGS